MTPEEELPKSILKKYLDDTVSENHFQTRTQGISNSHYRMEVVEVVQTAHVLETKSINVNILQTAKAQFWECFFFCSAVKASKVSLKSVPNAFRTNTPSYSRRPSLRSTTTWLGSDLKENQLLAVAFLSCYWSCLSRKAVVVCASDACAVLLGRHECTLISSFHVTKKCVSFSNI